MSKLHPRPSPASDEIQRDRRLIAIAILALAAVIAIFAYRQHPFRGPTQLLHVSYDASREFYGALNKAYESEGNKGDGAPTRIIMNHAGSTRQAMALARGQVADIVSLASGYDLDSILTTNNCVNEDWRQDFPHSSSPFYSTIALVTRQGNPKRIRDWSDLWREDVKLALPHPARSGAGRWAFLALYAQCIIASPNEQAARSRLQELLLACELIDAGARQGLFLFANASKADAFLTWESEVLLLDKLGLPRLQAVFFDSSILAEPRIALMPCHTSARKTDELARSYLQFHYSASGQQLAAKHGLRPRTAESAKVAGIDFPRTRLISLEEAFPDDPEIWRSAFGADGLLSFFEKLREAHRGGRE